MHQNHITDIVVRFVSIIDFEKVNADRKKICHKGRKINCVLIFATVSTGILNTCFLFVKIVIHVSADIYLLKVDNRDTKARCETCSKLLIKTLALFWCLYC